MQNFWSDKQRALWYVMVFSGVVNTPIPEKTGSGMEVRLTSPRGKFEITNMSDDQVDLTPEDIPGAIFSEEEIEKLTFCSTKVLVKMPPYKSKW